MQIYRLTGIKFVWCNKKRFTFFYSNLPPEHWIPVGKVHLSISHTQSENSLLMEKNLGINLSGIIGMQSRVKVIPCVYQYVLINVSPNKGGREKRKTERKAGLRETNYCY